MIPALLMTALLGLTPQDAQPLQERFGAAPGDVPFPSAPPEEGVQRAGEWALWIQSFATGDLARRAVARHQRVFRSGPGDDRPRLVWPAGDALELEALPTPISAPGSSYDDLERAWFLGDAIVYDRNPSVDRYAVAAFRVDVERRAVTRHSLLLSVGGAPDQQSRCWDERIDERELLRVGDHLLWSNQGGGTAARALRAADLRNGAALRPDAVEVRARDREALLAWCEGRRADPHAGAGPRELETWVVGQLARIGRAQDAPRLRALREAIEGGDRGRAALRAAYDAALEEVSGR